MRYLAIISVVIIDLVLLGCTRNISPDTYAVGSVGQINRAIRGIIINARQVNVSGSQTGVGAAAGAAAGGVAGSAIGGAMRENIVGAIGGAVVGGIVGGMVEEGATSQQGIEYVVETENGALITIVQGTDPPLAMGQKVIVIYGQKSRVIADNKP